MKDLDALPFLILAIWNKVCVEAGARKCHEWNDEMAEGFQALKFTKWWHVVFYMLAIAEDDWHCGQKTPRRGYVKPHRASLRECLNPEVFERTIGDFQVRNPRRYKRLCEFFNQAG